MRAVNAQGTADAAASLADVHMMTAPSATALSAVAKRMAVGADVASNIGADGAADADTFDDDDTFDIDFTGLEGGGGAAGVSHGGRDIPAAATVPNALSRIDANANAGVSGLNPPVPRAPPASAVRVRALRGELEAVTEQLRGKVRLLAAHDSVHLTFSGAGAGAGVGGVGPVVSRGSGGRAAASATDVGSAIITPAEVERITATLTAITRERDALAARVDAAVSRDLAAASAEPAVTLALRAQLEEKNAAVRSLTAQAAAYRALVSHRAPL